MAELKDEAFLTPQHTMPDEGPDAGSYWTVMRSLPSTIRELMASVETADLINNLAAQHKLTPEQRVELASFLRDLLLGIAMPDDVAGHFAERVGVETAVATQLLKSIENTLLAKAGLSIASISRDIQGPSVQEQDGRVLLRFSSLDDLLASIEEAPAGDRAQFLEDAKRDNRILVLKALSQLKLGTNRDGKPMTFSELVDREARDFEARDWIDLVGEGEHHLQRQETREALLTFLSSTEHLANLSAAFPSANVARPFHAALQEALGRAKPAVVAYVRLSPYFAGVFDEEQGVNVEQFDKFVQLPDEERAWLTSVELPGRIGKLVQDGAVPEGYAVAVAKTVFLVVVEDVAAASLGELFGKRLGLSPEQGSALAKHIRSELISETPAPEGEESPLVPAVSEPTTAPPRQPAPLPAGGSEPTSREQPKRPNVVDLRQRP